MSDIAKEIALAIQKTLGGYVVDKPEDFAKLGDYSDFQVFLNNLPEDVVKEIAGEIEIVKTDGRNEIVKK